MKTNVDRMNPMEHFDSYSWVGGLLVTVLLGLIVRKLLSCFDVKVTPPAEVYDAAEKKRWNSLIHIDSSEGPISLLGYLERTLFYFAMTAGAPTVIAAWLAFKAVTKWSAWKDIIQVREERGLDIQDKVEFLRWKNEWATQMTQRSLLGILINLLIAAVGLIAAYWLQAKGHMMMEYAGYFGMIGHLTTMMGLVMNVVAATLLLKYSTDSKSAGGTTVTQDWEKKLGREFKKPLKKARRAVRLLIAGFVFQFVGALLALLSP